MDNNICKFNEIKSGDLFCTSIILETTDVQSDLTKCDKHIIALMVNKGAVLTKYSESYKILENSIFFIEKNTPFSISKEENAKYLYITFHGRKADELIQRVGLSKSFSVIEQESSALVDFALSCFEKLTDENTDLLAEALLLYIFAHLNKNKKTQNSLLSKILSVTHESFTTSSFSLSNLAKMLGYDAKYISFFFKENEGVRFVDYLKNLRIQHSIFLIEQGLLSVKSIAYLSGFSDALYFSKVFKAETGKTPTDYINSFQKNDTF